MTTRGGDPFGTAALRAATEAAWRDSPTRLAEDLAAELDLVTVGYRERVVTELLQNAADAAAVTGIPGRVAVWHDDVGVHVANTGAALDRAGVLALSALRVSPKTGGDAKAKTSGDAAAQTGSDTKAKTGAVGRFGVGFTAVLTVATEIEVRSTGGGVAFSAARSAAAAGAAAPVLRLAFPENSPPATGFDSEIVLRDAAPELVSQFAAEAVDVLLDLPALESVTVDGERFTRPDLPEGAGPHARWIVGGDARYLHAPTRTDEPLTLPVRVVADLPVTSDRRRLHPDADVALAAVGYAEFVAAQQDPLAFLPPRRPPAGPVDARLREAVETELRSAPWLPGGLRPDRAVLLPGITDELYPLLAEVLPVLGPGLSAPADAPRLFALGVTELTGAALADALPRDRDPGWYGRLYDALEGARVPVDELGALPVPLADGRVVTGARGAVLLEDRAPASDTPAVHWARLVHPVARHPLLDRIGARRVSVSDLLADPALRSEIDGVDYDDPDSVELTEAVLALIGDRELELPGWLAALPVPGDDGVLYPADELLAAAAPLRAALGTDSPYGTLAPEWERRYPVAALRSIGVGWTFGVLREEYPTGPDDTLHDADAWWDGLAAEPPESIAVRDLDLVDHWDPALALIADLRGVLDDPDGYTAWWLRTHTELGRLRPPDDPTFAGLIDPCSHPSAGALHAALFTRVVDDAAAQTLFDALADPSRRPSPGVVVNAYRALAGWAPDLRSPGPSGTRLFRTVRGELVSDPVVLDRAHWRFVLDDFVFGGLAAAEDLAETLGLRLASEGEAEVVSTGTRVARGADPTVVVAATLGAVPDAVDAIVHPRLEVAFEGRTTSVPWWIDDAGLHVAVGRGAPV